MNPLADKVFLAELDNNHSKEIYAKIISLTLDELPVEEIEGQVTGGSVNIDGTSSVRRTCNLTMVAKDININDYYWGVKTKFKLAIGVKNDIDDRYPDIIWFPQGVYVITSFNTSHATNNYTITINGKDKMCLLNGDISGNFNSSIDFGQEEYEDLDNGTITITEFPIKKIIVNMLHVYGGEPYENIIINDLENYGVELLDYKGDTPLYMIRNHQTDLFENMTVNGDMYGYLDKTLSETKKIKINSPDFIYDNRVVDYNGNATVIYFKKTKGTTVTALGPYTVAKIEYGETAGYRLTDLTYSGDLIAAIGETVTSILDKIVTMLGNFEYYYDLDGRFIFQEKKNYINTSWNPIVEIAGDTYVENSSYLSPNIYSFTNNNLISAFQNNPAINNVKNDYTVWGNRRSISGTDIPIHMRYAIDKKPVYYKAYDGMIYTTNENLADEIKTWIKSKYVEQLQTELTDYSLKYDLPIGLTTPEKQRDGSFSPGWWDIRDWYEYYQLLTGKIPSGTMKWYSSNDENGCIPIANLIADGANFGTSGNWYATSDSYTWLLTESNGILSAGHGSGNYKKDVTYACVYYESYEDNNGKIITTKMQTDPDGNFSKQFHFPYAGCSDDHTYLYFLHDYVNQGERVYFYNPSFPTAENNFQKIVNTEIERRTEEYLSNHPSTLVDWREIIYRMAKDYYKHGEEDSFLSTVHKNNVSTRQGKDGKLIVESYYINGITGYEKYYIDIEGFWRQLYDLNPMTVLDNEEKTSEYSKKSYGPTVGTQYYIWDATKQKYQAIDFTAITYRKKLTDYTNKNIKVYVQNQAKNGYTEVTAQNLDGNGCFLASLNYYIKKNDTEYEQINIYKFNRTLYPTIYDNTTYNITTHWCMNLYNNPELLNFWFDILECNSELEKFSIPMIGDRPKVVNESSVKAIYFKETPDILFVSNSEITNTTERKTGYVYIVLSPAFENLFSISAQGKSAKNQLDTLLYNYSYCTENVTITSIPIYYLEPNNLISITDNNTGIDGEYLVSKLTIPLAYNGTMSITATKMVDRLY